MSKAAARITYGDVILGIPASPFPEFIAAFVQGEVVKIAAEWRLAFARLKGEPHHLWYMLRHILGSKFTYLGYCTGVRPTIGGLPDNVTAGNV